MHSYDHHIGDYTRDTVGLSMIEEGAYRRLIDQCYASELPLPEDVREIYRMARASSSTERKAVDFVLNRYFVLQDDGWRQNRVDRELAEYHGKSIKAKAAADERWERERVRRGHAPTMRTHSERNTNASQTHRKKDADASETHAIRNASRVRADAGDHLPPSTNHAPPSNAGLPQPSASDSPHSKPSAPTPQKSRGNGAELPTTAVWQAYSTAYFARYGTEPTRNERTNGQLAQFVARLGKDEAPHVSAFYLGLGVRRYVERQHPVGMLLQDCEGLRTQWATGRTVTETQARQSDKTAALGSAVGKLIDEAKRAG